jgi:hypothetical protein
MPPGQHISSPLFCSGVCINGPFSRSSNPGIDTTYSAHTPAPSLSFHSWASAPLARINATRHIDSPLCQQLFLSVFINTTSQHATSPPIQFLPVFRQYQAIATWNLNSCPFPLCTFSWNRQLFLSPCEALTITQHILLPPTRSPRFGLPGLPGITAS